MNSNLIRERWHRDTRPFVFRLGDGIRVPVAHPDFMMMPPGFGLIIVALDDFPVKKRNGKH